MLMWPRASPAGAPHSPSTPLGATCWFLHPPAPSAPTAAIRRADRRDILKDTATRSSMTDLARTRSRLYPGGDERAPVLLADPKPAVDAQAVEMVAQVRPLFRGGDGFGP